MRHGKKLDDGRKLRQNRPKPSPFVRLTFGEKHEIARYMKENQGMQLKQYAETFTKKWNRNVTERFVFFAYTQALQFPQLIGSFSI